MDPKASVLPTTPRRPTVAVTAQSWSSWLLALEFGVAAILVDLKGAFRRFAETSVIFVDDLKQKVDH